MRNWHICLAQAVHLLISFQLASSQANDKATVELWFNGESRTLKRATYAHESSGRQVHGYLFRMLNMVNQSLDHACDGPFVLRPQTDTHKKTVIALVQRGECHTARKVMNAVKRFNCSAVVIYENRPEEGAENDNVVPIQPINLKPQQIPVIISIRQQDGLNLVELLNNRTNVMMTIKKQQQLKPPPETSSINRTSVLFVSISFIVLMMISLAWLIFYYVQRFRYFHYKERYGKRLHSLAKKAIAKIPQRVLKRDDKEVDHQQCPICIELFKSDEVVRMIPCAHTFHKACIDPWLLENRSCPMCKLDILKYYGFEVKPHRRKRHDVAASDMPPVVEYDWYDFAEPVYDAIEYSSDEIPVVHIDLPVSVQLRSGNRNRQRRRGRHSPVSQVEVHRPPEGVSNRDDLCASPVGSDAEARCLVTELDTTIDVAKQPDVDAEIDYSVGESPGVRVDDDEDGQDYLQ